MDQNLGSGRRRGPRRYNQTERRQCVDRLECPCKRQHKLVALSEEVEEQSLGAALRLSIEKAQISGRMTAIRDDRMTRRTAERGQAREFAAVGVEDSRPARRQKRGEEPVFRGSAT